MNTKILIGIIIGVVIIIGGIVIFWYISSHSCPESCDDAKPCTKDICSKETNYKCSHNIIPNCCGNNICEIEEVYGICPVDCPDCDDNNECTKDSYDYHGQKCVNAPTLDVICCGNTICETSETYTSCSRDCPNCDDGNKCTKDSYDYHQQKCLNEVIKPCCGNGICDKGAETNSNCSTDCPNCNDNNKLTTDSFNYTTQKCENPITHYFFDDFESGLGNWSFTDSEGKPTVTAWTTIKEGNNTVLRGIEHNWANLTGKEWGNFIFKTKIKLIKKDILLNYRISFNESGLARYMININEGGFSLDKMIDDKSYPQLANSGTPFTPGWHTFEIRGYGNILNILMDNKLLIKYKDNESPILSGGMAFETLDGTEFLIDDVEIKLINAGDIIYP